MSANFYNAGGSMTGLDLHDYWGFIPPDPLPIPGKALHFVHAGFDGKCEEESTRLAAVTSSGKPMLQGGFVRERVLPHLPVLPIPPMPPYEPVEIPQLIEIVIDSSSEAVLKKGSVTGVGVPLAICIRGAFGTNVNCNDPVDVPTDVVHNENTVMTDPSAADFAAAWAGFVVDTIVGALLGEVLDKLITNPLLEPIKKKIEEKIEKKVQDLIKEPIEKKVRELSASLGVTHV